jgi:pSer/pThr/pTyr-binding forkhead associated (FHA) protein
MSRIGKKPVALVKGVSASISGQTIEVNDKRKNVIMGRAEDNDLVVKGNLISRIHAKIEMRRGKFVLVDQSTNGTFIQNLQGQETFVRRDTTELGSEGTIGLGRTEEPGSSLAIYYKTIE